MDILSIALAIFFLVVAYILFDRFMDNSEKEEENNPNHENVSADQKVKEVVYTTDYYPWWRSTRWWNYDGWLYQKPYYNYWRRP